MTRAIEGERVSFSATMRELNERMKTAGIVFTTAGRIRFDISMTRVGRCD